MKRTVAFLTLVLSVLLCGCPSQDSAPHLLGAGSPYTPPVVQVSDIVVSAQAVGADGGTADDWGARILPIVNANAYKRCVALQPGTYHVKTTAALVSGACIKGAEGVSLVSSLAYVDGHSSSVFYADGFSTPAAGAAATTLNATPTVGATTISVADGTKVAAGNDIAIVHGANVYVRAYTVISVAPLGGDPPATHTVTLDRPIAFTGFVSGDSVFVITRTKDLRIIGNGMTVSGTGDRGFQCVACLNSVLRGVQFSSSFSTFVASFDMGGVGNAMDGLRGTVVATSTYGYALEGNESSAIRDSIIRGARTSGVLVNQSDLCELHNVQTHAGATMGVTIGGNAATDVIGSRGTKAFGVAANNNGSHGIVIGDGSADTFLSGLSAEYNGGDGVNLSNALDNATPPTNVVMVGPRLRFNTAGAVNVLGGTGHKAIGMVTQSNTQYGVLVGANASLDVVAPEMDETAAGININGAGSTVQFMGGGKLKVTSAGFHAGFTVSAASTLRVNGTTVDLQGAGYSGVFNIAGSGAAVEASHVKALAGGFGASIGAGDTMLCGEGIDLSATSTPYGGAGTYTKVSTAAGHP